MEFDDIKKIWDEQNNRPLYAIDEEALHQQIQRKKRRSSRQAGLSESALVFGNMMASTVILVAIFKKGDGNIFACALIGLMLFTAVYVLYHRYRRKRTRNSFGSTLSGDLDHAISDASYHLKLIQSMRWYLVPFSLISLLSAWTDGVKYLYLSLIALFFCGMFYASKWEYNHFAKRKERLDRLRDKLMHEGVDDQVKMRNG